MSGLARGWVKATLGDVINGFETGRNIKASPKRARDSEFGVLKISAVTWGRFRPEENKALLRGDSPYRHERVRSGDLLISRANTTELVGAPVLVDGDYPHLMLPDKILRLLYDERVIVSRYLLFALRSQTARLYMEENATGTSHSMRNLSQPKLRAVPIPLAPLPEQARIVGKLDATLSRVDACRERLDRVPAILKRFRQSVLAAATSGALTEDWREQFALSGRSFDRCDYDLPPGWTWSCADRLKAAERYSFAIGPFGSNLKVADYMDQGVPLVFVRDIRARSFGGPGTRFVSTQKARELAAHSLQEGDLLITKMGDPPGDTAIYPLGSPPAIITADCIKLRVDSKIADARFVGYVIESPWTRDRMEEITAGVAQQKVSLERFRHFPLPLAPRDEQAEIVRRVECLFAYADRLEARYRTARSQVERLTPALLAKAFRGELVPQDPNDEPASALLERLRAQRTERAPERRRRKATGVAPG
ncbi:restriction endonuclease subunit S [Methylotetracoccus oryzae]|uniref:restriction endonuclease subunit S n=1 Tax=Methylotetracoccus oryzae TaxID=1919059 RepID=UPI00111B8F37|nr:restriction endonuclease subunit S [Methylotetracoccus oryzae]